MVTSSRHCSEGRLRCRCRKRTPGSCVTLQRTDQAVLEPEEHWPVSPCAQPPDEDDPEVKTIAALASTSTSALRPDPARYSSWTRYKRLRRLAHNFAATCSMRFLEWAQSGPLTAEELIAAETQILLKIQQENFPEERAALARNRPLAQTSPLLQLTPAFDADGILRVGGRLGRSQLPAASRHPIILPRKHDVGAHTQRAAAALLDPQSEIHRQVAAAPLPGLQAAARSAPGPAHGRPA